MGVHLARADARKMLETAEQASALKPAHIDGRVAQDFTGRAPERARVKTVGEQVALVRHDGHDGRKIHVEAEESENLARDAPQCTRACQIAMLSDGTGRGHGHADASQSVNEAALLVYAAKRLNRHHRAHAVEERA